MKNNILVLGALTISIIALVVAIGIKTQINITPASSVNYSTTVKHDSKGHYRYTGFAMSPDADRTDGKFWYIVRETLNDSDIVTDVQSSNGIKDKSAIWDNREATEYK